MGEGSASNAPQHGAGTPLATGSFARVVLSWRRWWRDSVVGTVDQQTVIDERREEAYISPRYMFMTAMSGGIAILGMLLSSPAVVIGAMLLSPLMGPIIGLGFALATADYHWLRQSARALGAGSAMAVLLCALIVFLSPLQTVTEEIAARTRPNLFDLLVALFSALAGAYAMIRGRAGTIVGVAIATALMPPLAAVGFGLATFNWTVFSGALLLYVTNLVTIALTAWGMARLYGFSGSQSDRRTRLQNLAILAAFVILAVPLGFSLRQIAWEANASRLIRAELEDVFGTSARLSQPDITFESDPMRVTAFVWTTEIRPRAEQRAEAEMSRRLGRPIEFDLKQFLVRDESSAERAQLALAEVEEEQAATQRATSLAQRLALAAGVDEREVLVDRQRRHAMVRARPLPGATLATYRSLEQRITATEPDWRIELIPPTRRLPAAVEMVEGEPSAEGRRVLELAAWLAARRGEALSLSGTAEELDQAAALVAAGGAEVAEQIEVSGPLTLGWASEQGPGSLP